MREISQHILDIAENGIRASADRISIDVNEDIQKNHIEIKIKDNGKGIGSDKIANITDPFITSRKERRVGLGLSLLKEACLRCGGDFDIKSSENGTIVKASFKYDHIDRSPMGKLGSTLITLISGHPEIDLEYKHIFNKKYFIFDTKDIKEVLGNDSHTNPLVLAKIRNLIDEAVKELKKGKSIDGKIND